MPAPHLQQSTYDRSTGAVGIAHIGFGAFHRAHQAFYIDRYMQQSGDLRWGIAAVNLRATDRERFAAARYRDGYVLKTVAPTGATEYHALRPHIAFYDWSSEPETAEQLLAAPNLHLATMTITESGYCLDDQGGLNVAEPALAAELAGGKARTIYAYLHAGLRRRMQYDGGPLTLLCCDNIRANGRMLQANLQTYLQASGDHELPNWLADNVRFPCSMVDRITPVPRPEHSRETQRLFAPRGGDGPTVMAEDFIQWVVEDDFAAPRPQWEEVGVTVTTSVTPFEETKIRILNGGHISVAFLGALAGYKTFDQVMRDPELVAHFTGFTTTEALPMLPFELPFDQHAYLDKVTARFGNRYIADSLERICMDGMAKYSIYLQPTVADCFAAGHEPHFAIRSIAAWYVLARRAACGTIAFNYIEPHISALQPLLAAETSTAFANSALIWGDIPRQHPAFAHLIQQAVAAVEAQWPA